MVYTSSDLERTVEGSFRLRRCTKAYPVQPQADHHVGHIRPCCRQDLLKVLGKDLHGLELEPMLPRERRGSTTAMINV